MAPFGAFFFLRGIATHIYPGTAERRTERWIQSIGHST
jgi:hypothetical protein